MPQAISIVVSILAFAISLVTAWLTLFRRGTIRMTQPTTIYFGADASPSLSPKIYLRTLLYSTAKRGQIIESMFVKLRRGESVQTFNIWVYGEDCLARGSGLYVGEDGVTCNHHFLLPADGTTFQFLPGEYKVEVYVSLVGARQPRLLYVTSLPTLSSGRSNSRTKTMASISTGGRTQDTTTRMFGESRKFLQDGDDNSRNKLGNNCAESCPKLPNPKPGNRMKLKIFKRFEFSRD